MDVKATLVERTSKKSGEPYICLEILLTPTYTKTVFLEKAELELLKTNLKNNVPSNK